MATAGSSKPRILAEIEPAAARPKRRRFGIWIVLAAMLLVVWLLPVIVARTSLCNSILASSLGLQGRITSGSASLGWFSSLVVNEVDLRDADGKVVLHMPSIVVEKSLLGLSLNRSNVGKIKIDHPVLHLTMRADGTNLEDAFGGSSNGGDQKTTALPSVAAELEVTGGVVFVHDAANGHEFQLENVDLDLQLSGKPDAPIVVDASGSLATDAEPAGFKLTLHTQPGKGDAASAVGAGQLECNIESLPLELLQPLVRRQLADAQLDGRVSAQLKGHWQPSANGIDAGTDAEIDGEITAQQFVLTAAALGRDRFQLQRLKIPCHIVRQGDVVRFVQFAVDCDLGKVSIDGQARWRDFSAKDLLASLARETYSIKGNVDLAKLSHLLPHTLSIRQDTRINSGQLQLALASQPQQHGLTWTGRLDVTDLEGAAGGEPIMWEKPVSVDFAAHDSAQGPVLDNAACESSFLHLAASGTLDNLSATADFNLQQLVAELERFVVFRNFEMAGEGHAHVNWKSTADERFAAEADFQARDFQLIMTGRRPWVEQNLSVRIDADGVLQNRSLRRVEHAKLALDTGVERLNAQLAQPLDNPAEANWPVQVDWQGQLAAWLPRVESWISFDGWDLGGSGSFEALVMYGTGGLELRKARLTSQPLHAWGHGWHVDEPQMELTGDARWDAAASRLEVPKARLAMGELVVDLANGLLSSPQKGPSLATGSVSFQGELNQLAQWRQDPRTPAAWKAAGQIAGQAEIGHSEGVSNARLTASIDQFELAEVSDSAATPHHGGTGESLAAARAGHDLWQERRLSLSLQANYDHARQSLEIDEADLSGESLSCKLAGKIVTLAGAGDIDLRGKLDYDWQKLAPLWRPYLGDTVKLAGRESREFSLRGPWNDKAKTFAETLKPLRGQFATGWTSAEIYGLAIGQGELDAQLTGDRIQVKPLDVTVGEGRLTFAPEVRLSPAAELLLPRGPLLSQMRITPELCARGLKFIAPVLAEATVAEGRFSLELEGGRVPLDDPASGDVAGQMVVDSVQVRPGPLAAELIALGKQIEAVVKRRAAPALDGQTDTLLSIDKQTIDFRLVDHRVYHKGLRFLAGNVPVATYGSVGLDESVAIMAQVQIPDAWVGNDPALASLKGQVLEIPIDGTLQHPKLDSRAFQKLAGQLLQGAAKGVLIDQLNKQLDKLIPGGE